MWLSSISLPVISIHCLLCDSAAVHLGDQKVNSVAQMLPLRTVLLMCSIISDEMIAMMFLESQKKQKQFQIVKYL